MGMDIRLPIGGLFSILGVMLVVYGFMTQGNEMYAKSEGININIWWGLVMFVFGAVMLVMGMKCGKSEKKEGSCDCSGNPGRGGMGH